EKFFIKYFLKYIILSKNKIYYEKNKDITNKYKYNSFFKNDFYIKFNRLVNMKILKKKVFNKPCQDKYSICKLWKNNNFCHNSFYSKSYRNHVCPKSCGLC
ncbi:ShKT domain-containing protein, partial [Strongyloides ratti]